MKSIKKLLTIGLAVLLMLCMSASLVGCFWKNDEKSARGQVKITFGLDIPNEAKLAYYYDDNGFQDWIKYCVFTFEREPTDWLQESEFSQKKDEDFERSMGEFLKWRTDGKNVTPQEYIPTFDKEYCWIQKGTYFLMYVYEEFRLIAYFVKM